MKAWIGWMLYTALFAYNLLDVYATNLIIIAGGYEMNPLLIPLITKLGVINGLLMVKIPLFLCLGVVLYLHQLEQRGRSKNEIPKINKSII